MPHFFPMKVMTIILGVVVLGAGLIYVSVPGAQTVVLDDSVQTTSDSGTSTPRFARYDQVKPDGRATVYSYPPSMIRGYQETRIGIVIDGPLIEEETTYWKINFSGSTDGWVDENSLIRLTTDPIQPRNSSGGSSLFSRIGELMSAAYSALLSFF